MKVAVGGQIDKQKIADMVQSVCNGQVEVSVDNDIQAAMQVKNGQADIYIGACNTGGGGALSMAIALLGMDKCTTLSMPGSLKTEEEILADVNAGKIAFGFTAQSVDDIVPVLMRALLGKYGR
ncbi:DUF2620 domain-containing protein [Desulfovibrio sp. OttesenSCG-928-G15]|nr:DUF2620 domain-containing protein [Desulfovibrio sp. OttesenSCG-928-G15]